MPNFIDALMQFRCSHCSKLLFEHSAFLTHGITIRTVCPRCKRWVERVI